MKDTISLSTEKNKLLTINKAFLEDIKRELEEFTEETKFSKSSIFPQEVLFTYELKNNNGIEGYYEDIASIIKIINNPYTNSNSLCKEYQRIMNLYNGYEFILQNKEINEQNLKYLYKILSYKLLNPYEELTQYSPYRFDDVFIYFSDNIQKEPDKGFDKDNIKKHMDMLFNYINSDNDNLSEAELFFKSQIIHFYMVYIHPYFDINGRTSRTTSLWFLNQNKSYPYTIFNRGIIYNKPSYYKIIREVKKFKDLTPFVYFIATNTKKELEKEYVIRNIEKNTSKLSPTEKQILQYILSNNSYNTLLDVQNFYNKLNPKKRTLEFEEEFLIDLFKKGILLKKDNTSKKINQDKFNYKFQLNPEVMTLDKKKIKRLNIDKFY
ncbi:MAG: Fic family protein [bacterium]|nr:Fic family protein [bacterium]